MNLARLLLTLLLGLWWAAALADAPPPLALPPEDADRPMRVTGAWEVSDRPEAIESLSDAIARAPEARWRRLDGPLAEGYGRSATWLRFSLHRAPQDAAQWLLRLTPPYLDEIEVLIEGPSGQRQFWRAGDRNGHTDDRLVHRNVVLPLELDEFGVWTLAIRIRTTGSLVADASVWPVPAFRRANLQEGLVLSLVYGSLLMMGLMSAAAWAATRDRRLSAFSANVFAATLLVAALDGIPLLLPLPPFLTDATVPVGICLGHFASLGLCVHVYGTRSRHRWLHRVIRALQAFTLLALAMVPLDLYRHFAQGLHLAMPLTIVINAWLGWSHRHEEGMVGRLLMIGPLISFLGALPPVLRAIGIVPLATWNLHSYHATLMLQPLVVLFALSLRQLRAYQRDMSSSRVDLALTQKENALLESRVTLRTAELQAEIDRRQQLELALSERLEETADALAGSHRALEQQRKFTAIVSHEFFTPLASIDLSAQTIEALMPVKAPPALPQRARRIREQVRVLGQLVEGCLSLARTDDAQASGETVSWRALVEQARTQANLPPDRPLHVEIGEDAFQGEPRLLVMALVNLLRNAAKYTPPGTPLTVQVQPLHLDGVRMHRLRVHDEGPGLDEALRGALFQPFRRGADHDQPGLGLGLYIVSRVAERHGGTASAPRVGRGACIELLLPAR